MSYHFPRSRFCNKNSSYKYLAQMNFISHSCLAVKNVYLINLKEHKNQKVKCKKINWYAVSECASLLTCFLWHVSFASANRCCLGENNLKSQSVIEFLLCVAGIKEYKSDTFRVTDGTTFYEMVALRIGFKLLLTYANCICNRSSTK